MKNKSILFLIALLLSSACCSCAATSPEQLRPQVSPTNETVHTALLTPLTGAGNCTGTETGFYEWSANNSGQAVLYYIDYASKTRIYLCSQPNCTHTTEQCTAWTGGAVGNLFAAPDGRIYGMETISPGQGTAHPVLWRMERDGSGRETVLELKASERFCDAVAGDEKALYVTVSALDGKKRLLRVFTDTLETETLLNLSSSEWLYGAYDDKLVILRCELPDEMISAFHYDVYDLQSGAEQEIFSYSHDNAVDAKNPITCTNGNFIYCIWPENDSASLMRLDMRTNEQTVLAPDVPYPENSKLQILDVLDGNVRFQVSENAHPEVADVYIVLSETGEVLLQKARLKWMEMELPVPVMAEYEDEYLVIASYQSSPVTAYSQDGTAYANELFLPVYALTSREDFIRDQESYQAIFDTAQAG